MVSGLATHATWARAFRPSRLPISAKVDLSGSDKRNRAGKCARKTRFSAAKYSFCRSSSWFTRPVTYASRRIHLVSFIWNGHNTPPVKLAPSFLTVQSKTWRNWWAKSLPGDRPRTKSWRDKALESLVSGLEQSVYYGKGKMR